jgi:hypothetical protein
MATQHYVFLSDTARRERQELLTKVHKRFKTPSSETLLFNASRVSDEATSPTALLRFVCVRSQSAPAMVCVYVRVRVCARNQSAPAVVCVCVCVQSVSTRRGLCVCVTRVSTLPSRFGRGLARPAISPSYLKFPV